MNIRLKVTRPIAIIAGIITVGVIASAAAAASIAGPPADGKNTPTFDQLSGPIADADISTALTSLITTIAANDGESTPTNVVYVKTTGALAVETISPGTKVQSPDVLYLVQAQGRFVSSRNPLGDSPAPTGSVLTVAVDPGTGHVFGLSLTDTVPALDKLGSLIKIE